MTILAVCGPIGSDIKVLSEQCYALLDKDTSLLIDSSAYSSDQLLSMIETAPGDVIIFGSDIFLDERLRPKFDIKMFLELDADLCLSHYLQSSKSITQDFEEQFRHYLTHIKPLNEQIRASAKYADLCRPQTSPNDRLVHLLISVEKRKLNHSLSPTLGSSFWEENSRRLRTASGIGTAVSVDTVKIGIGFNM